MFYLVIILSFIFLLGLSFVFIQKNTQNSKKELLDNFKSLSYDIIQKNNQSFMELAKASFEKYHDNFKNDLNYKQKELQNILNPVKDSLDKIDKYTKEVEFKREGAYASLNNQINSLVQSETDLRKETNNLVAALRSPNVRGAWGQMHLRRVVELAGLLNNCDFYEQKSTEVDNIIYRPDLIIKLPNDKKIIVDAKTPIEAYLASQDENEQNRDDKLKLHASNLRKHIKDLSQKEYFSKFDLSIEYVILFLPAEAFLSSAIIIDPALLEIAALKNIILATPTTLIAILKTIAHTWKEMNISQNAKIVADIGKDLYERLLKMNEHFIKVGKNLTLSVDAYNNAISSLNSRVMVSAKKLKDIGLSDKDPEFYEISKISTIKSLENI